MKLFVNLEYKAAWLYEKLGYPVIKAILQQNYGQMYLGKVGLKDSYCGSVITEILL